MTVEDQIAEADKVVSRITILGSNHTSPAAVDSVRVSPRAKVERWGLFE